MTTATNHTGPINHTRSAASNGAVRASKVIGTTIFNTAGEKIGKVEDVMLDTSSNKVMFGVLSFGGFLGIGEKYHPIPWASLNYSNDKNGYVISYTKEQLAQGPAHSIDELVAADSIKLRDSTFSHYKVDRDW